MQGRGGRGRGGGQTRTYKSTVSLTNNNHYYVITIREQKQCTEISINCKNYNNKLLNKTYKQNV